MADGGAPVEISIENNDGMGNEDYANDRSDAGTPAIGRDCLECEKKLKRFAQKLAYMEKAAKYLGRMAGLWASFVLLGGFGSNLAIPDFWFATIVLLLDKTKFINRDHEVDWQRTNAESGTETQRGQSSARRSNQGSRRVTSTTSANNPRKQKNRNPELFSWKRALMMVFFLIKWLVAVYFCEKTISVPSHVHVEEGDDPNITTARNKKYSLVLFYILVSLEGLIFLIEDFYYLLVIFQSKLLHSASMLLGFGESDLAPTLGFFIDCFSSSSSDKDMVTFGMDLLASESRDKQVIGVRILETFFKIEEFSSEMLANIGANSSVLQTLVEMLNWRSPADKDTRRSAAIVLIKLAREKENSLRIVGAPNSMESISSLLQIERRGSYGETDERVINGWGFRILKLLARDNDICDKIGESKDLLRKIMDLTRAGERILKGGREASGDILIVKRALKVLNLLAAARGATSRNLWEEILEMDSMLKNIRDILRHGKNHPALQKLRCEILASLAKEQDAKDRIGRTSGVLKELFTIFFREDVPNGQPDARTAAGEAIAMLALNCKSNCQRILDINMLEWLIIALWDQLRRLSAAVVLRNLCLYSGASSSGQLKQIVDVGPMVLKIIINEDVDEVKETFVSVAAFACKYSTSLEKSKVILEKEGIVEDQLTRELIEILKKHEDPPIHNPSLRRSVIEIAIWMMRGEPKMARIFKELELENHLNGVLETTSEIENFEDSSGTEQGSQSVTMQTLVATALKLLSQP